MRPPSSISAIDPSFVHIAPSVHFRRAKPKAADSESESTMNLLYPDLILLFTWTGAQPQLVEEYTSGYTKLFPSSPIMVITSSINDLLYRSPAKKERFFHPAIFTILSSHLDSNFLVHCFSESGAQNCVQFAKAYLKSTGRTLPISALCLDSARRTLNSTRMVQAWRESTRGKLPLHHLTSLLAYTLAASCWTTWPVFGDPFIPYSRHQFDKSRQAFNDSRLWDVQAPRCYLFSNTDKFTEPGSVIEHARSAEKLGAHVILAQFEDAEQGSQTKSSSPSSSSSNAEKYWATIERTWDASSGSITSSTKCEIEIEKLRHVHHVSVHELPTRHSPVDVSPEPVLSASSSIYSEHGDIDKQLIATATSAPGSSYKGPANFCIKTFNRLTTKPESNRDQ